MGKNGSEKLASGFANMHTDICNAAIHADQDSDVTADC